MYRVICLISRLKCIRIIILRQQSVDIMLLPQTRNDPSKILTILELIIKNTINNLGKN